MKTLQFTVTHANLEQVMCRQCIARLLKIEDLGHVRDHYVVTALVRDEHLDTIIEMAADRPRWVKWDET